MLNFFVTKTLPIIPFILGFLLSMFLYPLLDNKYKLSNKIGSKLKVNKDWKPIFITVSSLIFILILGIIGIYFINIPDMLYFSICGIIAGVASKITLSSKVNG